MAARPVRVLELRSVRGTGGGPEKTILLSAAMADRDRVNVTVCYLRDERDPVFTVDLEQQHIQRPTGNELFAFEIDPFRKHCLLNGLDDVGLTMNKGHHIDHFEARQRASQPWLHRGAA